MNNLSKLKGIKKRAFHLLGYSETLNNNTETKKLEAVFRNTFSFFQF